MKSLVALVLLAQLLSCKAGLVPEVPAEIHPKPVLGCDDPETEAAANVAVDHINLKMKHGYKVAINQIENVVRHERRPHGYVLKLELNVLETNCHIVDPRPAASCPVRGRAQHAVEGECDVNMVGDNEHLKVTHVKCHSSPDSDEDYMKQNPDAVRLSELNDTDVVNTVNTALAEFNAKNTTNDHYKLLEISRGHHSHLARGVYTEFAIVNTNCTAQQAKEHEDECHVATGEHLHYGFCEASTHKGIGENAADQHEVHCAIFDHQPGVDHQHLTEEHLKGNLPPAGRGSPHLDMIHSHNGTVGSHSHSHSDEVVPPEKPVALVKREIPATVLPRCPGRYRHFDV